MDIMKEKNIFDRYSLNISNACLISSFSNLFINSIGNISESDIFFVGDGMTFCYEWPKKGSSLKDVILFHDSNIMMRNFFEFFHEDIAIKKIKDCDSTKQFTRFIKNKIDLLLPVIISINTKYITYYQMEVSRYRPHFLTIIGYRNDSAIIADCLVPTVKNYETYVGPFDFENLYMASKQMDHQFYDFDYKHIINKLGNMHNEIVQGKFVENMKHYLIYNIPRLQDFAYNVAALRDGFSREDILNSAEDLFFNIKYNGILHSHILIRDHLIQYGYNQCLADEVNEISNRWEAVNYALLKNNLTYASQKKYDNLCSNILKLLTHEKEIFSQMI